MAEANALRSFPFYRFSNWCMRCLLTICSRWRVEGAERMPRSGPLLVISNHVNLADPPILVGALPRSVRFMAKEELFHGPIAPMTRGLGSFAVRRGQSDRQAIKTALELLSGGACVGMFPEGTRSRSGAMIRGQTGAGLIALRSDAPILPIGIVGTGQLTSVWAVLKRPRIDIIIGHPFRLPPHVGGGRAAAAAEATDSMMRQIAALLPPEMRGYYADRPLPVAGRQEGVA